MLPGILGSLQALEVLKVASGVGEPLSGKLFLFDALNFETRILKVRPSKKNPLTGENPTQTELIDYVQFCGVPQEEGELDTVSSEVRGITARELKEKLDHGEDIQVIDVRDPHEYPIVNIGGDLMPLGEISNYAENISRDKPVIVHCRSGVRSAKAIKQLESEFGFDNLYNLTGGVLAYAREVDTSLPVY